MRILVTGANGQLGRSLQKLVLEQQLTDDFIFTNRAQLDLSQADGIKTYINNNSVDVIINCAAYTLVDQAESEPNVANQINHLAVKQLSEIAQSQQIKLIHISTDYVFDGLAKIPYTEEQNTGPVSAYGSTKLLGEQAIQKTMAYNAMIIRTSWMYSEYGNNFVKTMLKLGREKSNLGIINDQIGAPTYAKDLARALLSIIEHEHFKQTKFNTQVYHYANQGCCSWFEFAQQIFQYADITLTTSPIKTEQYPLPAKRPQYSVLNTGKIIKDFELSIPKWQSSLKQCLNLLRSEQ